MNRKKRTQHSEAAQALTMMVAIVGFICFIGGTFDELANLFQFHLFLERVANSTARAASTQTRVTADGHAVLDAAAAQALGSTILGNWNSIDGLTGSISISGSNEVVVDVSATFSPVFLNLLTVGHGLQVKAQGTYSAVPVG